MILNSSFFAISGFSVERRWEKEKIFNIFFFDFQKIILLFQSCWTIWKIWTWAQRKLYNLFFLDFQHILWELKDIFFSKLNKKQKNRLQNSLYQNDSNKSLNNLLFFHKKNSIKWSSKNFIIRSFYFPPTKNFNNPSLKIFSCLFIKHII